MSAPTTALSSRFANIALDREPIRDKFRRALLIDDDLEYGESVKENLSHIRVKTTLVGSLDAAAQKLSEESYPFIFCDNVFADRPGRKGSEFLRDERELLKDAKIVLMTGFALKQIVGLDLLEAQSVEILSKREGGHIEKLMRICQETIEQRANEFTEKLESICSSLATRAETVTELEGFRCDPYLLQRAQAYLIRYLRSLPNQEVEQFYIDGNMFTPETLVKEVEVGSKTARELVDEVLDDLLEARDE